ncbi:hypothetical protein SAMN05216593_11196 [Pseudomonas asturiensis]|uniref:Uncharacterized protein n=2 Tax=Pseudomonas asturiensis TaxID=1190415 RepID=A0A1M7PK05_9PSED|nr:hypothetical protein SAMN05216593_11196 [Pseudomonas asturiensis]
MTTSRSTPSAAEQTRQAFRKKRLERARQDPDPTPDAPELNGVLGAIPGDDRNLWPKTQWGNDLTIRVPNSLALNPGEELYFVMDDVQLAHVVLPDPVEDKLREYVITAEQIKDEGVYKFLYKHTNGDGNTNASSPRSLSVDHLPPNGGVAGPYPELPQEIIDNGLTLAYLNSHASVDVKIPRSSDITAGDEILLYWGPVGTKQEPDPVDPVASLTVTEDAALPGAARPVVGLASDEIKKLTQGLIAVLYRYVDRTGNLGQPSQWQEIHVDLNPLAENLVAPTVPLADDGLIDRADARLNVYLEIPAPGYDNPQPGDLIEVNWENTTVPAVPLSSFPMSIFVDWPTLSEGGELDARTFKVSYSVVRGLARTRSPEIDIAVDFSVAGIDPDPDPDPAGPDPINDKLPRVVVKSREASPVDNVLGPADKDQDAQAQLTPNPVVDGQFLRLYWGALPSYVDEVAVTNPPADPVVFNVPWDRIREGGYSEKLPVYYSTWNGTNEQESVRTEVDVRIVDAIGLADVEFPDRYPGNPTTPIINCCSKPWDGIKARIPGDPVNFAVGDSVTVSWRGYEDAQGNTAIDGTDYTETVRNLNDDQVNNGFIVTVPYDIHVEPIVTRGSGRVTYVLTKASGQTGTHSTLVIVTRLFGAGPSLCTPAFPGDCS